MSVSMHFICYLFGAGDYARLVCEILISVGKIIFFHLD